jgi:hypothetical protein
MGVTYALLNFDNGGTYSIKVNCIQYLNAAKVLLKTMDGGTQSFGIQLSE